MNEGSGYGSNMYIESFENAKFVKLFYLNLSEIKRFQSTFCTCTIYSWCLSRIFFPVVWAITCEPLDSCGTVLGVRDNPGFKALFCAHFSFPGIFSLSSNFWPLSRF